MPTTDEPQIISYRFLYSPTTGDVSLAHNFEGNPAYIALHSDMEQDRSENDLIRGYAFRIVNGWRILDEDHMPIDDPHIMKRVVEEINEV